jgi:prepilin-type N-terminal cleavage/methylation domain-containing protein
MREKTRSRAQSGFSLVELSIVLVVIGLLLGGVIGGVTALIQSAQSREADKELELIRESLIGFLVENGRLPCADTDGDGIENGPDPCNNWGFVPFAQLGTGREDPWGGAYRYRVATNFAGPNIAGTQASFNLATVGNINIQGRNEFGNLESVATGMAVIVVSEGMNRGTNAVSPDEGENLDNNNDFIQNPYSNVAGAGFDDKLMWISPLILKAKMLEAGRLP